MEKARKDKKAGGERLVLKEIIDELVLIRKELQAINRNLEPSMISRRSENLYKISEYETKYIFQAESQVTVSFRLPSSDWLLIGNSDEWEMFVALLQELESKHNQKFY